MNEKSVFYISNINFIDGQNAENLIDLSFMPPMTRRKLSLVDKASLSVMHKAYNGNETEIVFASQYGELDRLDKIIAQYQEDNEVSPFTFSTSVHNCVAGQFSSAYIIYALNTCFCQLSPEEISFTALSKAAAKSLIVFSSKRFCGPENSPISRKRALLFLSESLEAISEAVSLPPLSSITIRPFSIRRAESGISCVMASDPGTETETR